MINCCIFLFVPYWETHPSTVYNDLEERSFQTDYISSSRKISICHPLGMWITLLKVSTIQRIFKLLRYLNLCFKTSQHQGIISAYISMALQCLWSCLKQYNAVLTIRTWSIFELPIHQWLSLANQEKKWKRSCAHLLTSRQFHCNHNDFLSLILHSVQRPSESPI